MGIIDKIKKRKEFYNKISNIVIYNHYAENLNQLVECAVSGLKELCRACQIELESDEKQQYKNRKSGSREYFLKISEYSISLLTRIKNLKSASSLNEKSLTGFMDFSEKLRIMCFRISRARRFKIGFCARLDYKKTKKKFEDIAVDVLCFENRFNCLLLCKSIEPLIKDIKNPTRVTNDKEYVIYVPYIPKRNYIRLKIRMNKDDIKKILDPIFVYKQTQHSGILDHYYKVIYNYLYPQKNIYSTDFQGPMYIR